MKSVGPKLWRKTRSIVHGANAIGDEAMRAFNLADLAGGVGCCRLNVVASLREEIVDGGTAAKFSTKVKANGSVGGGGGVSGEPFTKEIEWGGFC